MVEAVNALERECLVKHQSVAFSVFQVTLIFKVKESQLIRQIHVIF